MFLGSPVASFGQGLDLIGTPNLEVRLKRQFKLTKNDIKRLHPMIKRENENVLLTYKHYSEVKNEVFLSLWDAVRSSRKEFETGLSIGLTTRQKEALRAARADFESQILNQWLDDYLRILSDALELDNLQLSCVSKVFESETEKRRRLIINELRKPVQTDAEWQRLTDERERFLEIVLDSDQIREYHTLGIPISELVAVR
jgi:hypothetical protein